MDYGLQRAFYIFLLSTLHLCSCRSHLRATQDFHHTNTTAVAGLVNPNASFITTANKVNANISSVYADTFTTSSPSHMVDTRGKRAAILAIHMEGNLGDLMETTPLLRRLSEWGVHVDCYLSYWQGHGDSNLDKRLNRQVMKYLSSYIDNVYYKEEDFQMTAIGNRNYDVTIVAPGPAVNEYKHCLKDGKRPGYNVTMVWFGNGVLTRDEGIYQEEKSCLRLVAAREVVSKEIVDKWIKEEKKKVDLIDDSLVKTVLSGDLSFSFRPDYEAIAQHRQQLRSNELRSMIINKANEWVVIFSRSQNFGPLDGPKAKGIWIDNNAREVQVKTILGLTETYPLDNVIFASSSDLEDHDHYAKLESDFNVDSSHTIICSTIEQMWALVDLAPKVVTDRYHPGVVSLIQDTPLIITRYEYEAIKLAGLYRMQMYDKNKVRDYNEKAFSMLKEVILHGAQTQKGAQLTQSEIDEWNGWHSDEIQHDKRKIKNFEQTKEDQKGIVDDEDSVISKKRSTVLFDEDGGDGYEEDIKIGKELDDNAEQYEKWKAMNDIEHSRKFGRGFVTST